MSAIVGVLGASGGVGASTLAAVVSAVASGVLVDIDAAGGGIDVLLDIEDAPGARWSAAQVDGGRVAPDVLANGLVRWGAVRVLAADAEPPVEAVRPVMAAAAQLGVVAVDLGRAVTRARTAAVAACDVVVVLVPGDVVGVAAARVAVRSLSSSRVALVVRRGPVPPDQVSDVLGTPLVGVLPALGARSATVLSEAHLPRSLAQVAAGLTDGLR